MEEKTHIWNVMQENHPTARGWLCSDCFHTWKFFESTVPVCDWPKAGSTEMLIGIYFCSPTLIGPTNSSGSEIAKPECIYCWIATSALKTLWVRVFFSKPHSNKTMDARELNHWMFYTDIGAIHQKRNFFNTEGRTSFAINYTPYVIETYFKTYR